MSDQPVFYYELHSPYSWLAAERINQTLPEPPVWKPVSYGHIVAHTGVLPWSFAEDRSEDFDEIARRAEQRGLPRRPLPPRLAQVLHHQGAPGRHVRHGDRPGRSPSRWPRSGSSSTPAGGSTTSTRSCSPGAACELHPNAILKNIERDSIKQKLTDATNEAIERGVTGVPTVAVGDQLFCGDDRLEDAATAMAASPPDWVPGTYGADHRVLSAVVATKDATRGREVRRQGRRGPEAALAARQEDLRARSSRG